MNTTFLINGGAGRVLCAIPALEKYLKSNPNDDFKILVDKWEQMFWSHPTLQQRTFNLNTKGVFDNYVKNYNLKVPEPYTYHRFYNQQCDLVEAFDELINNDLTHSNLKKHDYIYLEESEKIYAQYHLDLFKRNQQKNKVVVIQPFSSNAQITYDCVLDETNRSVSVENYFEIVKQLSHYAVIIFMGEKRFRHPLDNISHTIEDNEFYQRNIMSIISECDFFIGIDSLGHHIAKSFRKRGLILMGGTLEENFNCSKYFKVFRKKNCKPVYPPLRINPVDINFSNKLNDGFLNLNDKEINQICKYVIEQLKKD